MHNLITEIAEIIDDADDTNSEAIADVVIDTITAYLDGCNKNFLGALTPAIELLSLEAEASRLRRTY